MQDSEGLSIPQAHRRIAFDLSAARSLLATLLIQKLRELHPVIDTGAAAV